MPIEILPEGEPDWSIFSATTGILFLGIDPFWSSKADFGILYRGGQGFLDRSVDDGQTWTSILPGTVPPWFGDDSWQDWYYSERPYGMPSGSAPAFATQLKYAAYSANHANSGEHYVLVTYTLPDGGGISPSTWDVHVCWILYTTDDWATHKWSMVKPYVYRAESVVTPGSPTTLTYSDADKPSVFATRLSDTKVAVWVNGTGVPQGVYIITESGGTLTEENFTSGAVDEIMFNRNGNYLYFGEIYQDRSVGGIEYYRARAYEWDVTTTTPSLTTYNSGDLPGIGSLTDFANTGYGAAWHLTDAGRLCFKYWVRNGTGASTETLRHYLFYFDVVGHTWSAPYLYYDGLGNTVPRQLDLCAMTVDDSNKMIVIEIDQWTWTGRGTEDWKCYEFMMIAGTWSRLDSTNFYNYLGTTYDWRITPAMVCELSGNRVSFWITRWFTSGVSGIAEARIYTYDTVSETITYHENPAGAWPATVPMSGDNVSSLDAYDRLHVIGYNKMDNPSPTDVVWLRHVLNRSGSTSDRMYRFDPSGTYSYDTYLVYSSEVEYDVVCLLTGYNADGSAEMIQAEWVLGGGLYTIDVAVVTVDEFGPDHVISRLPSGAVGHQLACALDGERLWFGLSEWADSSDDSFLYCYLEYMTREPDGQVGILGYPIAGTGYQYMGYASGFSYADHLANLQYISLFPWALETDGVLVYGLPWAIEYPTWPDQLFGESPSAGQHYYWGASGFTDPVRAVLLYNSKVYAFLKTSTTLDLYEEKAVLGGAGNDMQLVSATTLNDASIGIIAAADGRDGAFVVTGVTDTIIVIVALPPWTSWSNLTLSHRIDRDVTGVVIL